MVTTRTSRLKSRSSEARGSRAGSRRSGTVASGGGGGGGVSPAFVSVGAQFSAAPAGTTWSPALPGGWAANQFAISMIQAFDAGDNSMSDLAGWMKHQPSTGRTPATFRRLLQGGDASPTVFTGASNANRLARTFTWQDAGVVIDVGGETTAGGNPPRAGTTVTAPAAGRLVVVCMPQYYGTPIMTVDQGFTLRGTADAGNGYGSVIVVDKDVTAGPVTLPTFSWNGGTGSAVMYVFSYLLAASAPLVGLVHRWDASQPGTTLSNIADLVGSRPLLSAGVNYTKMGPLKNGLTTVARDNQTLGRLATAPAALAITGSTSFSMFTVMRITHTAMCLWDTGAGTGGRLHCYGFGTPTLNASSLARSFGAHGVTDYYVDYFEIVTGSAARWIRNGIARTPSGSLGAITVENVMTFMNTYDGSQASPGADQQVFCEAKICSSHQSELAIATETAALRAKWGI